MKPIPDVHKEAAVPRSPRRPEAGAGHPSPAPAIFSDIQVLKDRMNRLEAELAALKGAGGDTTEKHFDLYSPESVAEFKLAIRRWHIFNDRKPLEKYLKKTGGKVPKQAEKPAS
jgi:hypothetical protein